MMNFIKKYNTAAMTVAALLLVGCGGSGTVTEEPMQAAEWSVQIVAEDGGDLRFHNDRLGQVNVANSGVDSYDLKAMSRPFPKNSAGELNPFLSVNFPLEGANYLSNYHSTEMNEADEWVFTVNTNPDRTVTLSWNAYTVISGPDETGRVYLNHTPITDDNLVDRMQLVDAETNTTVSAYAVGKLQSYTFNMNSTGTQTFRWQLLAEKVEEQVQEDAVAYDLLYRAASLREDASKTDKQIDLTMPPRPMGQ